MLCGFVPRGSVVSLVRIGFDGTALHPPHGAGTHSAYMLLELAAHASRDAAFDEPPAELRGSGCGYGDCERTALRNQGTAVT